MNTFFKLISWLQKAQNAYRSISLLLYNKEVELRKKCHAPGCKYPSTCPERHIECRKGLNKETSIDWNLAGLMHNLKFYSNVIEHSVETSDVEKFWYTIKQYRKYIQKSIDGIKATKIVFHRLYNDYLIPVIHLLQDLDSLTRRVAQDQSEVHVNNLLKRIQHDLDLIV